MKGARVAVVAVVILLIIAAVVLKSSLFVVDEMHHAVVTQFGEVKRSISDAGLYVRTPFIQDVRFFPRQVLRWIGTQKELVTKDKTYIKVETWARWRITDPQKFYQALRTESRGHGVLDDQIESATKDVIASYQLIELVRTTDRDLIYTSAEFRESQGETKKILTGRKKICEQILAAAGAVLGDTGDEAEAGTLESVYGIELIDVQISEVIYVPAVLEKAYERMRAERMRIAQRYRSEGDEQANRVVGDMRRQLLTIRSEGNKRALRLRGEGDAAALAIYAAAYGKDPEFYRFWKTLKTYEKAVDKDTTLILSLDNAYFRLLAGPDRADPKTR